MSKYCPYRKITTTENKPVYNSDGEKSVESTATETFALCVEEKCRAWDGGICILIEQARSGR